MTGPENHLGAVLESHYEGRFITFKEHMEFLKELYDLKKVYYPGCGNDSSLEEIFDPGDLVYSDRDPLIRKMQGIAIQIAPHHKVVLQPESVDAIFFKDNHAGIDDFANMVAFLRPGGIIILGNTCFGEIDAFKIADWPGFNFVDLPFYNKPSWSTYQVFQKDYGDNP